MQWYRVEMTLQVAAESADHVRQIADETIEAGQERASQFCSETSLNRGEPVTINPPVMRPRSFDAGASAC